MLFKIERNVARWIVTDFGYDVPIATVIQVLDNVPLYLFLRENSIVYCTSIASALARATQEQVILSLEDIKIYAIVNYTSYDVVYEQLCEHYTEHNHELPISDVYQIVGVNMQQLSGIHH